MRPQLRIRILERDAFTCQYCGAQAPDVRLEVDHVIPRSKGGADEPLNLVTACAPCNRGKRALGIFPPRWGTRDLSLSVVQEAERVATTYQLTWQGRRGAIQERNERNRRELAERVGCACMLDCWCEDEGQCRSEFNMHFVRMGAR